MPPQDATNGAATRPPTGSDRGWVWAYHHAPQLLVDLGCAEDRSGRAAARFCARAALARSTVVEIGAGAGRFSGPLAKVAGRYLATEPNAALLGLTPPGPPPNLTYLQARGEALPLPSGSVDRVVAAFVLPYLSADRRQTIVDEAERILRRGAACGIWLLENYWQGELQALRGRSGLARSELKPLFDEGFELVERVPGQLRFASSGEAERILGALCGETLRQRLADSPRRVVGQDLAILYRTAGSLR